MTYNNRPCTKHNPLHTAKKFRSDRWNNQLFYTDALGWHQEAEDGCHTISRSELRATLWQWLDENLGKSSDRTQPELVTPRIVNAVLDALEGISYDFAEVR